VIVAGGSPDRITSESSTVGQLHSLIAQPWDELRYVCLAEPSWDSQHSESSISYGPAVDVLQTVSRGSSSYPAAYAGLGEFFASRQNISQDFSSNVIESSALRTSSIRDFLSSDTAHITITVSWDAVLRHYSNSTLRPRVTDIPLSLQINYLQVAYAAAGKPETRAFIEAHPHLVSLLYAAIQPLRTAFPGSRFTVRIDGVPNPGMEESPEALLVTIWTKADPVDALACLHNFNRSWWLECQSVARGQLCFDVGFA